MFIKQATGVNVLKDKHFSLLRSMSWLSTIAIIEKSTQFYSIIDKVLMKTKINKNHIYYIDYRSRIRIRNTVSSSSN